MEGLVLQGAQVQQKKKKANRQALARTAKSASGRRAATTTPNPQGRQHNGGVGGVVTAMDTTMVDLEGHSTYMRPGTKPASDVTDISLSTKRHNTALPVGVSASLSRPGTRGGGDMGVGATGSGAEPGTVRVQRGVVLASARNLAPNTTGFEVELQGAQLEIEGSFGGTGVGPMPQPMTRTFTPAGTARPGSSHVHTTRAVDIQDTASIDFMERAMQRIQLLDRPVSSKGTASVDAFDAAAGAFDFDPVVASEPIASGAAAKHFTLAAYGADSPTADTASPGGVAAAADSAGEADANAETLRDIERGLLVSMAAAAAAADGDDDAAAVGAAEATAASGSGARLGVGGAPAEHTEPTAAVRIPRAMDPAADAGPPPIFGPQLPQPPESEPEPEPDGELPEYGPSMLMFTGTQIAFDPLHQRKAKAPAARAGKRVAKAPAGAGAGGDGERDHLWNTFSLVRGKTFDDPSRKNLPASQVQALNQATYFGSSHQGKRRPLLEWRRTEARSHHEFCMHDHAIAAHVDPPAGQDNSRHNMNHTNTHEHPRRAVPPPEEHTVRGMTRTFVPMPSHTLNPEGTTTYFRTVLETAPKFKPKQTPSHLRWPQEVINTLVPTYVPQTQGDKAALTAPRPAPPPGPDYGKDPLMAEFLRARANFRATAPAAEQVDLQVHAKDSAPDWLSMADEAEADDDDVDQVLEAAPAPPLPTTQKWEKSMFGTQTDMRENADAAPAGKAATAAPAEALKVPTTQKAGEAANAGAAGPIGKGGKGRAATPDRAPGDPSRLLTPESKDKEARTKSGRIISSGKRAKQSFERKGRKFSLQDNETGTRHIKRAYEKVESYHSCHETSYLVEAVTEFDLAFQSSTDIERDIRTHQDKAEVLDILGHFDQAMLELRRCVELDPENTSDLIKIGEYEQIKNLHLMAIKTFTKVVDIDPTNSTAYHGRGVSHAALLRDQESVRDLSQAIHLNPESAVSFFHRGAFLSKLRPQRALMDLSVSLLIDSSETNLLAYVHRGQLYLNMGRYDEAMADFEQAISLIAVIQARPAHVQAMFMAYDTVSICVLCYCQLGYIHVRHTKNYMAAVRNYGAALREDPTSLQALLSRAECYSRVHRYCGGSDKCLEAGVRDYGAAIRCYPNRPEYYILRGKLLLALGNTELATDQVRAASAIQSGSLSSTNFIEAQVQAFLGNHSTAAKSLQIIINNMSNMQLQNESGGGADASSQAMRGNLLASGYCHRDLPTAFALLGRIMMSADRYEEAISKFEAALGLDNTNPNWFFDLGRCCAHVADDTLALEAFSCAIQLNGNHADAYYQRGICRLRLRDRRGIQDINKALSLDPKMWQAYLSRACYFALLQRFTKAILNCNRAVSLKPDSARALMTRGCVKYQTGKIDGAVKDLKDAIDIDSDSSLLWYNLAVCYHHSGDLYDAIRAYSTVLLLEDQPNPVVHLNRGCLYFGMRDYANALYDFIAVSETPGMERDPRVIHSIALCRHRVRKLEQAVEEYTQALAVDPHYTEALLGRGNVYTDYGHAEGRVAGRCDYQRAIRVNPMCIPAYVNLCYSLQSEGRFQDAWNITTTALSIAPHNRSVREARAIVSLQMSNFTGALKDMTQAIGDDPTAELLTNRGVVHVYLKQQAKAMADFQNAVKINPSFGLAWYNAANIYLHQRQLNQALKYYDKAIANDADDECVRSNRALTRALAKDYTGAQEDLAAALGMSQAPMLYYNRAVIWMLSERWASAEDDLTHYIKLLTAMDDAEAAEAAEAEDGEGAQHKAPDGERAANLADARSKRGWCKFRGNQSDRDQAMRDFVDSV